MQIFTGNYETCRCGNLISISGDRGRRAMFKGKAISQLAPKREFWNVWHSNVGKISELENTRYYIMEYYRQVLSKVDVWQLLKDEESPILLCYEPSCEFCHRHVLAEYINIKYGIEVQEVEIDDKLQIKLKQRPRYIRELLKKVIEENEI